MEILYEYLEILDGHLEALLIVLVVIALILGAILMYKCKKQNGEELKSKDGLGGYAKPLWIIPIVLTLIGAGVWWWLTSTSSETQKSGSWQSPSLKEVGVFAQSYWLLILIVWGVGAILLLNAGKEWIATFQTVLLGVVFTLLIGFPAWTWISSPSSTSQNGLRSEIPLASSSRESWLKLVLAEGGKSQRIPVPPQMTVVMFGEEFRVHCVYRDGHEIDFGKGEEPCPKGNMPFVYATNEAKGGNIILYAYAPI